MLRQPLVSIIIPTRNEEKNISRCISSVKKQAYPQDKIELIVVDNYSADKTLALARELTKHVYKKGQERSSQRNYGAELAKGKHLLFLDADMQLSPDVIEEVADLLEEGNTIVSIPEVGGGRSFWEKAMALERECYLNEKGLHAARGFPKDLFKKVGGYDVRMFAGEDWDLTLRCKEQKVVLETTSATIIHYESVESIRKHLKKERHYITNIHLFASKHPKEFARMASLRYRGWLFLKNFRHFARHPIHALGLFGYKLFVHLWSRPHWKKK